VSIEKCVGRIADIIYQDSKNNITKRQVTVYSVKDGKVKVFDTVKRSYRTLNVTRILAVLPALPYGRRA
jgi:hypothetical protein